MHRNLCTIFLNVIRALLSFCTRRYVKVSIVLSAPTVLKVSRIGFVKGILCDLLMHRDHCTIFLRGFSVCFGLFFHFALVVRVKVILSAPTVFKASRIGFVKSKSGSAVSIGYSAYKSLNKRMHSLYQAQVTFKF